jgi:hypothetical protein
MLELLIAADDSTQFRFDAQALTEAARLRWPQVHVIEPAGPLAGMAQVFLEFPDLGDEPGPELTVLPSAEALTLEAHSREAAAPVLAWLAEVAHLPADGSVVVIHWIDDFYPLRPGVTVEALLQA